VNDAPAPVVCEGMYVGECLTLMLDMTHRLNRKIVIRGEVSFHLLKGSTEVVSIRFFRLCDLVSPQIRWKTVCIILFLYIIIFNYCFKHSPLILRSDYCFLWPLPHLVSAFYDTPREDSVFPTTVPCRLIVRVPQP
jgi:hypothetical protein